VHLSLADVIPGGSTAAVMALHNPDMLFTVVDRDDSRIRQWNSRHLPIREPGLLEILRITRDGSKRVSLLNEPVVRDAAKSLPYSSATSECESHCDTHSEKLHIPARSPNMFFSLDISKAICEADVVFITVNTPTKKRGLGAGRATDITAFEAATKEVAINAKAGTIIVQKSTVSCGTSDMIREMVRTTTTHKARLF
jgi:UDPglucose 6-dehydrogenase